MTTVTEAQVEAAHEAWQRVWMGAAYHRMTRDAVRAALTAAAQVGEGKTDPSLRRMANDVRKHGFITCAGCGNYVRLVCGCCELCGERSR